MWMFLLQDSGETPRQRTHPVRAEPGHSSTTQFGWLLDGKYIFRGVYKPPDLGGAGRLPGSFSPSQPVFSRHKPRNNHPRTAWSLMMANWSNSWRSGRSTNMHRSECVGPLGPIELRPREVNHSPNRRVGRYQIQNKRLQYRTYQMNSIHTRMRVVVYLNFGLLPCHMRGETF